MCYQKFKTFVCGCGTLEVDEPCDYATHPFSIRLDCPEYSSNSHLDQLACSQDGWWCAKSKDAAYIIDLKRLFHAAATRCEHLSKQQQVLQHKMMNLKFQAQSKNIFHDQFNQYQVVHDLKLSFHASIQQRSQFAAKAQQLSVCIEEVKAFYMRYGGPSSGFSKAPSFLEVVGPRVSRGVTSAAINTTRTATPRRFPEGDTIVVHPRQIKAPTQSDTNLGGQRPKPSAQPQQVTKQASPVKRNRKSLSPVKSEVEDEQPAPRRSTRVNNKKVNYEESDGSSPTRAVSPGESDVSGFDPSNRSDGSGSPEFSPPKRKRGRPPQRAQSSGLGDRRSGAPAISFGSKISEYRERLHRMPPPSNSETGNHSTHVPRITYKMEQDRGALFRPPPPYQVPQVAAAFPNARPNGVALSRPPTRYGPPNQHSINPQLSSSTNNYAPPAAMPNFLQNQQKPQQWSQASPYRHPMPTNSMCQTSSNRPSLSYWQTNIDKNGPHTNANQLQSASLQEYLLATSGHSSATQGQIFLPQRTHTKKRENRLEAAVTQIEHAQTESPYNRMKRSFGATADFTLPATTDATPPTTDPKKRKQPVSSPLQSSSKRPRLSFPGEELPNIAGFSTPTLIHQRAPRSSPSRLPAHTTTDSRPDPLFSEQEHHVPAPAPNLAPTAVMYQPSLRTNQPIGPSISDITNEANTGQISNGEDGYDDGFFDELIEEDRFSAEFPEFILG